MYRERASALPGAVIWSRAAAGGEISRILPDGCIDLIWSGAGGLIVAGPDTVAQLATGRRGDRWVGLRFPPGTGPAVLGLPAYELRDRRVPLADVWPDSLVQQILDRAVETGRPGRVLESVAVARLCGNAGPDPAAAEIVGRMGRGETVAATAAALGLSARHLHRRCQNAFGYGPKTLARILRMRRALTLTRAGVPPAEVAAAAGYADQAHLSREVKALAGVPLGRLAR